MKSLKKIWNLTDDGVAKVNIMKDNHKLKHGMFAAIPLICKGSNCPYDKTCNVPVAIRDVGGRCPLEISTIVTRFDMWCEHFNIDSSGDYIADGDLVDATLIRDLVDIEVQILRAENKIAINGDFITESIANIDTRGNVYYEDKVGPESDYKMSLMEKRYKVMQLLNSTRKDNAKKEGDSIVSQSIGVFKELNEKLNNINLEEVGDKSGKGKE